MDRQNVERQVSNSVIVSTAVCHPILLHSVGVVELTEYHQVAMQQSPLVSYMDR